MTIKLQTKSMRAGIAIKPCGVTWYSVALHRRVSDREGESP
jgi:hypothetical protein